jgi:succinate dehydrogenase flavin-adding protein (antitoxin of CptAB toxin-antitoxin module)
MILVTGKKKPPKNKSGAADQAEYIKLLEEENADLKAQIAKLAKPKKNNKTEQ